MSDFPLTPAAPGTVAPAHLRHLRSLHGAVGKWLDDSADAQKKDELRANLPYADLMFAFAFATAGDHATANRLLDDARQALDGPIPCEDTAEPPAVIGAVVRNFLFRAFRYRIEQALAGKPHGGQLSMDVREARDEVTKASCTGPVNGPYKFAGYVIDRFRQHSLLLEPDPPPEPYSAWGMYPDVLKQALAALPEIGEPDALAERVRRLYRDGVRGQPSKEVQFRVLHEALPLAPRAGEAFVAELLAIVPAALHGCRGGAQEPHDFPRKQAELLERALSLAAQFNRPDMVRLLVDDFAGLVRSKPVEARHRLVTLVGRSCLRGLKGLGLTAELDRLLSRLRDEMLAGTPFTELRKKNLSRPEAWSAALQTLLALAGGWLTLDLPNRANPILTAARNELFAPAVALQAKDYAELARAYVTTIGEGTADLGFARLAELFRKLNLWKLTSTFTTGPYFSRFHVTIAEDAVFAACRLCLNAPANAAGP